MDTVRARVLVLVLVLVGGCGVNTDGAGEWTAIDQLAPPLVPEVTTTMPLRSANPVGIDPVRIVTYNIFEENADTDPIAVANAILSTPELAHAGVFVFQEAEQYPDEDGSRVKPIAERLGLNYVYVPSFTKGTGHTQGLAILSEYPIENVMRKELPLCGSNNRRTALAADIVVADRVLHVIMVHLELRTNAAQRVAQLRPAVLDAPDTTVIAGDFNMFPVEWAEGGIPVLSGAGSIDQSSIIDSYMIAQHFDTPTRDSGPTAFGFGQEGRADAIYTRGLDVTYGGAPHVGPSDHLPVWVDVRIP
jgi:endonuclease/exonuclease/phosphatase family metal-dependent hydrolase